MNPLSSGQPKFEDCPICLEDLVVKLVPTTRLICNHTFHLQCIEEWKAKRDACPLCERKIEEAPEDPAILILQISKQLLQLGVQLALTNHMNKKT